MLLSEIALGGGNFNQKVATVTATPTNCNTLQHAATHSNTHDTTTIGKSALEAATATRCNTLQYTATQYNTIRHPVI